MAAGEDAGPGDRDLSAADLLPADTCGCHAGQICVAGQCEFQCTGLRVPGDCATLAEALAQVQTTGGTICLGAGAPLVAGQLSLRPPRILQSIGVSALRTLRMRTTCFTEIRSRFRSTRQFRGP